MNAYHERELAAKAKAGAEDIKRNCKERRGKCHIDGLPDCQFYDIKSPISCNMRNTVKPMYWNVK